MLCDRCELRYSEYLYSLNYACPEHGISIDELSPRMFSFNNPYGACQTCTGLGTFMKVNPDLVIPNKSLSISEGAICASGWGKADKGSISAMYYTAIGKEYGFNLNTPIKSSLYLKAKTLFQTYLASKNYLKYFY